MVTQYFNTFIIATIGRPSLEAAIESVLNQHRQTLIIVVFDNEDIVEIVKDPNVVYLKTAQHVWGEGARQFGIDWCIKNNVKTTYISYLDDDDIVLPSYTSSLEKFDTYDIIVHSMKIFENGRIVPDEGYYTNTNLTEPEKIKIATQPLLINYIGLTYSLKWEKAKTIKWTSAVPPDFNYINTACKSGLSHFKTGIVSYHQLTRGLTGSHANRKFGANDNFKK
jgi:glycosyltransferase involved in cell wall biosynthesis